MENEIISLLRSIDQKLGNIDSKLTEISADISTIDNQTHEAEILLDTISTDLTATTRMIRDRNLM